MKVAEKKEGAAMIFSLEGRLDSNTSPDVDKRIIEAIGEGVEVIILDFSGLEYLSSAGIRVLAHCHKEIKKKGGQILLAAVPKPIENVLYITGFLPYFTLHKNAEYALASVR